MDEVAVFCVSIFVLVYYNYAAYLLYLSFMSWQGNIVSAQWAFFTSTASVEILEQSGNWNRIVSIEIYLTAFPPEDWKRLSERPRITWMKTVLNNVESHNLTLTEAVNMAENHPLSQYLLWVALCTHCAGQKWWWWEIDEKSWKVNCTIYNNNNNNNNCDNFHGAITRKTNSRTPYRTVLSLRPSAR